MTTRRTASLVAAALLALAPSAQATGSPETTVLVVNARSGDSLAVANAWVRMRHIPVTNVVYLDDVPGEEVVPVETFRARIWQPILAWLDAEGMTDHADLIVYSVGFPYGVDFAEDVRAKGLTLAPPISGIASLTSMTYLARHVAARDPARYLDLAVNRYFRRPSDGRAAVTRAPTPVEVGMLREAIAALQAKDHAKAADLYGQALATWPDDGGSHYNHACCLALLGRSDEAMAALERALEHGWANASHMESDTDLEALRGRAEFGELLARMRAHRITWQATRGFRSRDAWSETGEPIVSDTSPDRYWLSAMLGYTGPNGSTRDAVITYLQRSSTVDGTRPEGTFCFMANDDVRANTREPLFSTSVDALRALGLTARVLTKGIDGQDGVLPLGVPDVLGLVAGTAGFDWSQCGSAIVPGAIAEHLTSFGAHFGTAGQTKCVRFLEAGAAGTCGTVAEPYAVQPKFPVPFVHVHYASGVSMVEAMYQSLAGPYQTMVLGDPLARPFATFASVTLAAPSTKKAWSGTVEVGADVRAAPEHLIGSIELWVDGRCVADAPNGEKIRWDTTATADGGHELRVVAVEDTAIGTRSAAVAAVTVRNGGPTVRTTPPRKPFDMDATVTLSGTSTGCAAVEVRCSTRVLARVEKVRGPWKAAFPAAVLGAGVATLQVRGIAADGRAVGSAPFDVTIR